MFAQTARFFLAFKISQREENRRAARRDGQGIGAANQTQRGDFAKREGEAFQRFAFGMSIHLRIFPMRFPAQRQAEAKRNKMTQVIPSAVVPPINPNSEIQAPDAPKQKANTAKKP
jgi:hypothetical protein